MLRVLCRDPGKLTVEENKMDLREALEYYKRQGAPGDQNALIGLLREIQGEYGGIPPGLLPEIAAFYGTKDSLLTALIRRIPSLRLADTHTLEICGGPNCGKHRALWELAEKLCKDRPDITLKQVPCMRLCGKGPNLRWDGKLYHKADEAFLRKLITE